ncbi:hypothetical protein GUJ93_ZPchr0009g1357 [Zizania palustris]|uniref:Uncharacterized protein n=1 Tax=Zizania palustris TaxID=103762 RepID=A0A8J5VL62_ZIZPA|nr:hypothetical protein GUJ93_ZPchr0009g1357 [Zizania palustris]
MTHGGGSEPGDDMAVWTTRHHRAPLHLATLHAAASIEEFWSSGLQKVNLESNMLDGGILEGLGVLPNLSVLLLATNSLTGKIPLSIGSSSSLSYMFSSQTIAS